MRYCSVNYSLIKKILGIIVLAFLIPDFCSFGVVNPASAGKLNLYITAPDNEEEENQHFSNPIDSIAYIAEGNIEIDIAPELIDNILQRPEGKKIFKKTTKVVQDTKNKGSLQKIKGYRVQVFGDGRKQSQLENQAKQRGNAIVARFPKYRGQIYTFSQAPNWYTRVGNFQSASEAQAALSELKSAFPKFAGEMRVVNSTIYVLK